MAATKTPRRKAGGGQPKPTKRATPRKAKPAAKPDAESKPTRHEQQAVERKAAKLVILERLAVNPMFTLAAMAAGVHPKTLSAWRKEDPEFDLACQSARFKAVEPMVARLGSTDAATSASAARWLEKCMPREFGRSAEYLDDDVGSAGAKRRITISVVRRPAG